MDINTNETTLPLNKETTRITHSNISAVVGLMHCLIMGMVFQSSTTLVEDSFIRNAALCLFTAAVFGNLLATLIKLECTASFILIDSIFSTVTAARIYFNSKMTLLLVVLLFTPYGVAIGYMMNIVPVYILQTASDKYRVLLLNSIGGLGIVGGFILFRNAQDLISLTTAFGLILGTSLLFGLFMGLAGKRVRLNTGRKFDLRNLTDIFSNGPNSAAIIILAMVSNNYAGINYIVFNSTTIFKDSNALLVFNLVNFFAQFVTYLGYLCTFKFGRKQLMLFSSAACLVGNLAFLLSDIRYHRYISFFFILSYNLGLGNIPFVLTCEVFPPHVLQEGSMIGSSANFLGGLLFSLTFSSTGKTGFIVSMVYLALSGLYFAVFMKETKGQKEGKYQ
ncbi:Sugar transporter [Enterospora canceri]|uniref:Sugar transporter n=1 Tax=Enterospora canceri TaxID=1081671 RepID=A0A1Y1S873_9MICR|nr:Sugar transporter [Enterospora canceri]